MIGLNVKSILRYKLPPECRVYLESPKTETGIITWHILGNLGCETIEEYRRVMATFNPTKKPSKLTSEQTTEKIIDLCSKNAEISHEKSSTTVHALLELLYSSYSEIQEDPTLLSQGK